MVDAGEADVFTRQEGRFIAGQERAGVVAGGDETMDHLAIGADGGAPDAAVRVPQLVRQDGGNGAALQGLAVHRLDIVHFEADVFHSVAVQQKKQLTRVVVPKRRGEHQPDTALLQYVGGAVGMAGFRSEIGDLIKPQDLAIEKGRFPPI